MTTDDASTKILIEGSQCFGRAYAGWEKIRSFTTTAISRSGTVLDVGCANGYFLVCARSWAKPFELLPYGVDVNPIAVEKAKELLPGYRENFAVLSLFEIEKVSDRGLPSEYDFVYCSLLGTGGVTDDCLGGVLMGLYKLVTKGGRLIVGLYGSGCLIEGSSDCIRELEMLERRAGQLAQFVPSAGCIRNPHGTAQIVTWFDR